jgi:hypothetical protein
MMQITIAGQIKLPDDAEAKEEAIDRIRSAMRELAGLQLQSSNKEAWSTTSPFQSIYLSDDGQLKMNITV